MSLGRFDVMGLLLGGLSWRFVRFPRALQTDWWPPWRRNSTRRPACAAVQANECFEVSGVGASVDFVHYEVVLAYTLMKSTYKC